MRIAVLWWVLCVVALVHPSHTQDAAAATAPAPTGSFDPDDPNFDVAAALAELKARSAAGISPENQGDTMRILTKVITESSKMQEGMMGKLSALTQAVAKKRASGDLMKKMDSMKTQVEGMGTIGKLADVVKTFGGGLDEDYAKSPPAPPPPVTFTPPSLAELKAKAAEMKGEL